MACTLKHWIMSPRSWLGQWEAMRRNDTWHFKHYLCHSFWWILEMSALVSQSVHYSNQLLVDNPVFFRGVINTNFCVYSSTHTNLALRKIMEEMRTVYTRSGMHAVSTRLKLHMRQTMMEGRRALWKEHVHRLLTFQYFTESCDGGKGAFEMRQSFLYFVGTHFRIFVRKFLVHLRTVYASLQKLARPLGFFFQY